MSGAETAGNYKGVMLCNRPADTVPMGGPGPVVLDPKMDAPRFRPVGLPQERIGLNPAKENVVCNVLAMEKEAARRRAERANEPVPDNFMTKHRRWLAEMAKKKSMLNAELQASANEAEEKRTKFTEYAREMRRTGKAATYKSGATLRETQNAQTADVSVKVSCAPAPARVATAASVRSVSSVTKPASSASNKPKWAMTEEQADEVEEDEADDLVNFASGLDYDSYIDDLEVRQALSVIKDRIDHQKAMEAAAEAAEEAEAEAAAVAQAKGIDPSDWRSTFLAQWNDDDDDASSVRSSRRGGARSGGGGGGGGSGGGSGGGGGQDWDASTTTSETRAGPSESARQQAEEMLRSNPSLAGKHSVRSLAAAVEHTSRDEGNRSTLRTVAEESANLPPLRLVTVHENPRVKEKSIDASNLPYLHRNPAV